MNGPSDPGSSQLLALTERARTARDDSRRAVARSAVLLELLTAWQQDSKLVRTCVRCGRRCPAGRFATATVAVQPDSDQPSSMCPSCIRAAGVWSRPVVKP